MACLGNEAIAFVARFDSVIQDIVIPIDSVRATYAKESGQGMFFDENNSSVHATESI